MAAVWLVAAGVVLSPPGWMRRRIAKAPAAAMVELPNMLTICEPVSARPAPSPLRAGNWTERVLVSEAGGSEALKLPSLPGEVDGQLT